MKIGITGTHGAGKTTLSFKMASLLKQKGKNVTLIQEVARKCPFPLNEKMNLLSTLWIYHEQCIREIQSHSVEYIICDRTRLDSFIYAEHFNIEIPHYLKLQSIRDLYSYDKLIFVTPDMNIESDNFRSVNLDFQSSIHDRFKNILINDSLKEKHGILEFLEIKTSEIFNGSWMSKMDFIK